ncbi:BTAD domain-containing putative transcriptional regulator [Chitinivorax sp. PXF-14]|uniref:BTAD domain-containing putative transcriptional regulator n=1 Tax=Chitinivorax sp. PXF-14 TaxID=3230488 RepID=UPI003467B68A
MDHPATLDTPLPAKLSPPHLYHAVERPRLRGELDRYAGRPLTWVQGPEGCGKTTLVASYAEGRPAFWFRVDRSDGSSDGLADNLQRAAHHWVGAAATHLAAWRTAAPAARFRLLARALFALLPAGALLVFDEAQEAHGEHALEQLLRDGIDELPESCRIIVISRDAPPPMLSRLLANQGLGVLAYDRLMLVQQESQALLASRGIVDAALAARLHEQSGGWLAGLMLLVEQQQRPGLPAAGLFAPMLDELDAVGRADLMRLALLPEIDPALLPQWGMAPRLAAQLADWARRQQFVSRLAGDAPRYLLHPMLRTYLLQQASAETQAFREQAVPALYATGHAETALRLLADGECWDAAARLLCELAPGWHAEPARHPLLRLALSQLPEDVLQRFPWLLLWRALSLPPAQHGQVPAMLDAAFQAFAGQHDRNGQLACMSERLAWQLADARFDGGFDQGLAWLVAALDATDQAEPALQGRAHAVLLHALLYHQPGHTSVAVAALADRCTQLLRRDLPPRIRLGLATALAHYIGWHGGRERYAPLLRTVAMLLGQHPLPAGEKALWLAMRLFVEGGDSAAPLKALLRALRGTLHEIPSAERSASLFAPACLGLARPATRGCCRGVLRAIQRHAAPRQAASEALGELVAGWLDNRVPAASALAGQLALWHAYLHMQQLAEHAPLDAVLAHRDACERRWRIGEQAGLAFCFGLAECYARQRASQPIDTLLRALLAQGLALGLPPPPLARPQQLATLCAIALEAGIEPDYCCDMIARGGLCPPADAPESWPWPVRIYTLGRFDLVLDGTPLHKRGKAPSKALELLKTLVALGGQQVSSERLTQLLWPDASPTQAQAAFGMALHRLRKLMPVDAALRLDDTRLSLNPDYCWVDAAQLERSIDRLLADIHEYPPSAEWLVELGRYRAPFLSLDGAFHWAAERRDRLHAKFLSMIEKLAQAFIERQAWPHAAATYCLGLARDPGAERCYRGLMNCHLAQGQAADALTVFRRCRELLATRGRQPSAETESLYRQALQSRPARPG